MMNRTNIAGSIVYYRLIALWALNEAMLGGIIHGLKIPVSGLIVGSCAVICIALIGWYVPKKGAIIKATLIVAIFKMMLSPQAPPPAYVAVFFQGLLGELVFWNRRFFTLSCLLLAIIALVESGLQRILTLTIIYGNDFWKVINDFISNLIGRRTTTNYVLLIAAVYVIIHAVTGVLVGWLASVLPGRIVKWSDVEENKIPPDADSTALSTVSSKRKKRIKKGLLIVWILLVLLYVQSYFKIGTPLMPSHVSLKILLRSLIIVLSWIFIVGPLLRRVLHFWLQKKRSASQWDIQQVLQLLPSTQQLIKNSWKRSAVRQGWKRITMAGKLILVNSLGRYDLINHQREIIILTGPVQSGKTTSLMKWIEQRKDVFGILTPVINGKRMFKDAHTGDLFDMEARKSETEVLPVGRFVFSKTNFEKAARIVFGAIDKKGWLVIDEVGPLELRGEGFTSVIKQIISAGQENQNVLLVVRETMVEKVKAFFRLDRAVVVRSVSELEKAVPDPTVTI